MRLLIITFPFLFIYSIIAELTDQIPEKNILQLFLNSSKIKQNEQMAALAENFCNSLHEKNLASVLPYCDKEQVEIVITKLLSTLGLSYNEIKYSTSQTANHIKLYVLEIFKTFRKILQGNLPIKTLFQCAYQYETTLTSMSQKKYAFYHAQKWELYWLSLIYTKLWAKKYSKKANNYLFLRYPHYSIFSDVYNPKSEDFILKQLMNKGRIDCYRPKLLFMNCSFLGNTTNISSCTFCYFLKNWNLGKPPITTQDIFSNIGYETIYERHQQTIHTLEKQFYALSNYGNILQIIMPESYMKKYVYLCSTVGYKSKAFINNNETEDVTFILDNLKHKPENLNNIDQYEFCWVVTHNAIKEAINEVEIHCYNITDTEKFSEIMNNIDEIISCL